MGLNLNKKLSIRERKKARVRKKILGTTLKPRLCVFRSSRYTYAQLISDDNGSVLGSVSSKILSDSGKSTGCVESAKEVGKAIARIALEKKIELVVFDRNGYLYHGRVAAVAEGARESGLKF